MTINWDKLDEAVAEVPKDTGGAKLMAFARTWNFLTVLHNADVISAVMDDSCVSRDMLHSNEWKMC